MDHVDIINYLIEKYNYKTYLEIGLGTAGNYIRVNCQYKECVDPYNHYLDANEEEAVNRFIEENILTYKMTSDELFDSIDKTKKWDLIFIDGLHIEEQVDKDIINSLKHLNKGGRIVIHDCLPECEEHQTEIYEGGTWNGTTWKSIPKLALMGIEYMVIDTDYGCGIVEYKENADSLVLPPPADYNYNDVFSSDYIKRIMMRIIPPEALYTVYNG